MTRKDYAKEINWNGTATRMIETNEIPCYKIGDKINPGLCWTDGGQFTVETSGKYAVLFLIEEKVEGHQIDYDNEEECFYLDCEDCFAEKEILINNKFEVIDFWQFDQEIGYAKVFLKKIV